MGANSKIEWCHHTFNPWLGCTKVSAACDHCYAEGWAKRTGQARLWNGERRRTSPQNWRQPYKWNNAAPIDGARQRVFCASLADVFDNQVPDEWRRDLWAMISETPNLDWLLLTKRPQNIAKMLPENWNAGWPNVWLGTTVENQEEADLRIPHLIRAPAKVRFLSCEPLLGQLDLTRLSITQKLSALGVDQDGIEFDGCKFTTYDALTAINLGGPMLHWVICGGESGPHARPMHPDWARSLRDQCAAASVPFFFKQWGEWAPDDGPHDPMNDPIMDGRARCSWWDGASWHVERTGYAPDPDAGEGEWVYRLGKSRSGRLLDGIEHNAFPVAA